jgi:lipid-A-disaccharide synthase-like uncharacterized protein
MIHANIVVPYSATAISITARIIFMYLLYTKKSVNNLSLVFCLMNIASSSLWMKYSLEKEDSPLVLRSSVDIVLFFISASYIVNNKWAMFLANKTTHPGGGEIEMKNGGADYIMFECSL